jgi:hypothetical protein
MTRRVRLALRALAISSVERDLDPSLRTHAITRGGICDPHDGYPVWFIRGDYRSSSREGSFFGDTIFDAEVPVEDAILVDGDSVAPRARALIDRDLNRGLLGHPILRGNGSLLLASRCLGGKTFPPEVP